MNQILATSNPTAKKSKTKKSKTRKSNGPADIKTVVRVFAIAMLIFGVFMVGTGSYAIYRENEANNSEITKPVISESLNGDGTAVILTVTHDKTIDRIEYSWNDEEIQTITGNGRKYIEQQITIPSGTNTLNVTAIDTQGQEISTQKEFSSGNSTSSGNTTLDLTISEDNKLRITANSETEIQYMTYKWDDGEEQRVDINATTIDQEIDVPMGTHDITVAIVDINNKTTTKEEKVMGTTKPMINVETDDAGEYYLITITDEVGLQRVDLNIRGEERTITVDDGKKELKYKIKLEDNNQNRLEITAYNVDGIVSDTVRKMADKTNS